jgi:hypothetical protein
LAIRSPRAIASRPWPLKKPLTADMQGCILEALIVPAVRATRRAAPCAPVELVALGCARRRSRSTGGYYCRKSLLCWVPMLRIVGLASSRRVRQSCESWECVVSSSRSMGWCWN